MKKKVWVNGNKMLFESEHKTFNRQCKLITTGNQIGDVVYSSFVRPYNETECNGFTNPKGHLQEYDLNWLLKDVPEYVKDWIREYAKTKSVIAYHFFYRNKESRKIDIGYVVTTPEYKKNELLEKWYAMNTLKVRSALDEAIKYIVN